MGQRIRRYDWENQGRILRSKMIQQIEKGVMFSSKMRRACLSREITTKKGELLELGSLVWGM